MTQGKELESNYQLGFLCAHSNAGRAHSYMAASRRMCTSQKVQQPYLMEAQYLPYVLSYLHYYMTTDKQIRNSPRNILMVTFRNVSRDLESKTLKCIHIHPRAFHMVLNNRNGCVGC